MGKSSFLQEFKAFAMKGNVIDMAVGVIIGGAFGKIVSSIVADVIIGMEPVIPPKRNRKELREYDKYLYRMRHLVENAFLALKQWRGIATRYAKTLDAFVAAIQVRCIVIWLDILA